MNVDTGSGLAPNGSGQSGKGVRARWAKLGRTGGKARLAGSWVSAHNQCLK
jgi:hypothetical protein